MRCVYEDGTKIKYTGPFQITRGNDVNIFIKEELIPDDLKADLEMALFNNSCALMRDVGERATKRYGTHACVHEG